MPEVDGVMAAIVRKLSTELGAALKKLTACYWRPGIFIPGPEM
jgi:hypothetical protein